MKTTMTCTLLLATLVAAPGAARADVASDTSGNLANFAGAIGTDPWYAGWLTDKYYQPSKCDAVIAKGKKDGLKATDVLTGSFQHHPKMRQSARGDSWFEIDFGDAPWICEEYARQYAMQGALVPLREAAEFLKDASPPTAESAAGYNTGAGEATADKGRACAKAVDDAIAGGVPKDAKVKLNGTQQGITAARQTYCQGMIDWGTKFEAFISVAQQAKRAEKAAKYEALGVSGAKLELFIEYDDVHWRGKGCAIVDDLAVIVKAKKLFQWLENSNGTHTIRTYTFKGNTYKAKDKTYKTEKKAYKGCK